MSASAAPRDPPQYRLLVVVRRGNQSLYDRLSNQYGRSVAVMWDRRQAERRRKAGPIAVDRWSGDRRQPVPETWMMSGFVVATVRR